MSTLQRLLFSIPLYYTFYSRYKSKLNKLSWIAIYLVPLYAITYYFTNISLFEHSIVFILGLGIVLSVYELGYMENDIKTIQNEKNPTLRLMKEDYIYFNSGNRYLSLVLFKIIVISIMTFILYFVEIKLNINIYLVEFFITIFLLRLFFYLHNTIRNRFNILTFFLLSMMKYLVLISLFIPLDISIIILVLLIFPLLRVMEHATKKKYLLIKYTKAVGNHDLFRIKYYLIIVLFSYFVNFYNITTILLFLSSYFLLYRVLIYIIIRKKIYTGKRGY